MGGSRRWRTLGGRSRDGESTPTRRGRGSSLRLCGSPPSSNPGWVAPRRRVATHEENGDNICEGGIAWVSADRGMRGGDLQGLGACAGMGRYRRGALGPEVEWFTMAGQPLGPVAGGDW